MCREVERGSGSLVGKDERPNGKIRPSNDRTSSQGEEKVIRRTGSTLVRSLLVWGVALCALTGDLNAFEPIATRDEASSDTVTRNVKQVVGGQDYRGVLEISHLGIAYVSGYTEWLEFTPWSRVLGWKCFGSKHAGTKKEDLCSLWILVEKVSPHAGMHLFFKVPCEIVSGQENWETLESYDPRDHF
jgi:hypothetical protein